jgi:hypothetical protein
MIYYNTSNVGIGTYNPKSKLHLYDETINITSLTIQNFQYVPPTITASPTTTGTTGKYTYMVFTYTGETAGTGTRQTLYNINISKGGFCDILMVGGGGAGGGAINNQNIFTHGGGGGGGGAVLYGQNIYIPQNNYEIRVGDGAIQGESQGKSGSFFFFSKDRKFIIKTMF